MKKKTKIKLLITLFILICLHFATYSIDFKRVSKDQNPIFVIKSFPAIKDGGSAVYYGLGYQVIKWINIEHPGKVLIAYEIHRIPFFKNFEAGPDSSLKFVDYYSNK